MTVASGLVAEWLRSGLQNRVRRFNSGRGLHSSIRLIWCKLSFILSAVKSRCSSVVEQWTENPRVASSILAIGTITIF